MPEVIRDLRHYRRKTLRAYWSVHIEAWVRSGVSREQYCREHDLNRRTFHRWILALEIPLPKPRRRVEKQSRRAPFPPMPTGVRARAAFWLMHVEALRGSGLKLSEYAHAHGLQAHTLSTRRLRFSRNPPRYDWREWLRRGGPEGSADSAAANGKIRDELRDGAAKIHREDAATAVTARRRERRSFSDAQKLAIVAEAADPGVNVSAVARRHGIRAPMVFRWRTEFGVAVKPPERALLATVRVLEKSARGRPRARKTLILEDLLPVPAGAVLVELADGRRVYAPAGSDPEAVRAFIAREESPPC